MLWFLFEKLWNYFMEIQIFPRQCQNCKAVCIYVCVCTPPPAPCMYTVLQEVFYSLSAASLHFYSYQIFLRVSFSRIEFLTTETSKPQICMAAKFCSREEKGFSITECSVLLCMLTHSSLKILRNLAAWEPGTVQSNSLILPFLFDLCHLLSNIDEVEAGAKEA